MRERNAFAQLVLGGLSAEQNMNMRLSSWAKHEVSERQNLQANYGSSVYLAMNGHGMLECLRDSNYIYIILYTREESLGYAFGCTPMCVINISCTHNHAMVPFPWIVHFTGIWHLWIDLARITQPPTTTYLGIEVDHGPTEHV